MNWDLTKRREYLLRLGFDINKVNGASDEWVIAMTSHLSA